ncbi:hypothetical protein AB0952_26320 [Streptomyces caniferus]|uniref:hypothetical protein n=1 Tax=Streptomyces caniferus TaxID=285557 RepID=UPI003452B24B
MDGKRMKPRIIVPLVSAATVGALAVGGAAFLRSASPDDQISTSAAGQPPALSGRSASDDNPAHWHLPIEAYMPTEKQKQLIAGARDSLIDACMKEAGHEEWTPAPDLPALGGKSLVDWRYGIHDAALAAERGYKPAAGEQEAYDRAAEDGAVGSSGGDETVLKGCVQKAAGPASADQRSELVQQISGDSFEASTKDPAVVEAFAKWSACMAKKGYAYKKPMDANDDDRFADPYHVSSEEKETAKADISCRGQSHVQQTWFDAEVTLQESAIKKHQKALNEVKKANGAAVARASAVAGR